MNNKKNKVLLGLCLSLFIFLSFSFVSANYGLETTVNQGDLKEAFSVDSVGSDPGRFVSSRLGILIGAILSFIGVIFMVLIIFGGIQWMTARGNEQQVEKSKNLIIQAIIGLIIILSAYAITAFIGRQLTDTNPTEASLKLLEIFYC
ncbi:MAG: hypothetical protein WC928_03140 [Patescibacteria group bacterium]|jgi:cbb3-type cytochrome oxidase subunit 3